MKHNRYKVESRSNKVKSLLKFYHDAHVEHGVKLTKTDTEVLKDLRQLKSMTVHRSKLHILNLIKRKCSISLDDL